MSHGSIHELRKHPLVFVDDLHGPVLSDDDARHVTKSLRVRPGARLAVGDGHGRWRWVRLGEHGELELELEDETIKVEPEPVVRLTLAFAPVKGDRSDLIVQKATELGIDRIAPVHTSRSVVRWDGERATKNVVRHRRIAKEAAMQSRRTHLPEILAMSGLSAFVEGQSAVAMAEPGGSPLGVIDPPPACLVVGPEGGFDPAELENHYRVGLPGHILRSETAAIVGAALMRSRFDDSQSGVSDGS